MKKHVKTLFATIGLVALLFVTLLLANYTVTIEKNGFDYSAEENIDDKFGKLDSNTRIVVEEYLENAAKESNVEIYFSFVHENINESYINNLTDNENAIYVYYNDTTKTLDAISKNLSGGGDFYTVKLSSKEEIAKVFPDYVTKKILENVIETPQNHVENLDFRTCFCGSATLVLLLLFVILCVLYVKHMKKYIPEVKHSLKDWWNDKAQTREAKKDKADVSILSQPNFTSEKTDSYAKIPEEEEEEEEEEVLVTEEVTAEEVNTVDPTAAGEVSIPNFMCSNTGNK